jgi:hypothetical protein
MPISSSSSHGHFEVCKEEELIGQRSVRGLPHQTYDKTSNGHHMFFCTRATISFFLQLDRFSNIYHTCQFYFFSVLAIKDNGQESIGK